MAFVRTEVTVRTSTQRDPLVPESAIGPKVGHSVPAGDRRTIARGRLSAPVSRRDLVSGVGAATLLAALTACTGGGSVGADPGQPVNGDPGTADVLKVYPVAERKAGPDLRGALVDGSAFDLASWKGSPVVVNVWASWCGPCKTEQPGLVKAAAQLGPLGVRFLGLDHEASRANAQAHMRKFGVRYPSLADPAGAQLLRFHGLIPAAAIPSTVVLDAQHRIAAVRVNAVTQATLVAIVQTVLGT